MPPSERYQKEIRDLTAYLRARLPACGPIKLTEEERKAGVDSLTGVASDLVKSACTEWLLMRNYELSYNQVCYAFFAALDSPIASTLGHFTATDVERTCTWTREPDSDIEMWETDCGNAFQFEADGPTENKMKFCCYCGKQLAGRDAEGREEGEGDG